MKKLLTFLLTALLAFGVGWATDVTFEITDEGTGLLTEITDSNHQTVTSGDVTLTFHKGTNNSTWPRYYSNGLAIRMYPGNTLTVSCSTGKTITQIKLIHGSASTNELSLSSGETGTYSYSQLLGTWTGSSSSVQFYNAGTSGNARLYRVIVTVEDGSTPVETCATPTFFPAAGTYSEAQSVTISTTTSGANIYYTTDSSTPSSSNGTLYTGAINVSVNTLIKAIAVKNGNIDSQVAEATYIINTSSGGSGPFELVDDASTLNPGDEIIFVSSDQEGDAQAMSTTQNNNNRPGTTVNILSGPKVNATTETQIFTLMGSAAGWYFFTGSGYIYAQSSSSNNLRTEEIADDNAKATITISNNQATVTFQGSNTRNNLRYNPNGGNPIFSCYSSTSTQAKPYIYRRSGTPGGDPILTISPASQTIDDAAPAQLTITGENVSGNINASLATNTDWYLNPNTFSGDGGTTTLTYTGRALSATNTVTATASGAEDATATVNYVADLYIVTDNGVTNDWHFDGLYSEHMTCNNGVYTADFIVTRPNTYILFARKLGNDVTWNTRYVFGPNSIGDYGMTGDYTSWNIDLYDDDPIYFTNTGIYTVTINANDGTFTITRRNINVTISPEDGTHFTGTSISGTISSDPAGTIEWSTDNTNWQTYNDGFTATVNNVGGTVTVYARSTYNGLTSDVVSATYTRDYAPAPDAPSFSIGSSAVASNTVVTITAPEGCTLYVDGQQVTNPYDVTITHGTTITAYCVNDEGTQSTTVTNTYTIAAVCSAEVRFKSLTSDSSTNITWNSIGGENENNYFEAGRNYISGVENISHIFKGKNGFKFGTTNYGGSITFNLADNTEWKVNHITLNASAYNTTLPCFTVTTSDGQSKTTPQVGSTLGGYTLEFRGSAITSITISSDVRAYLKGFTITYDCAPEVEAPVINPATGTYYENQTVHMSADAGCTIYYTTNGTDPTTSSPVFTDDFNVSHNAGSTTTIKAIAVDGDGIVSDVTTVVYTWGVPSVHIHPDSRNTTSSSVTVTLTPNPTEATIYYTTDGSVPTTSSNVYSGAFTVDIPNVGDQTTVKAIAVLGSATSPVATATYTHVEKMLNVHTPFFSPLVNHTYYGDQTLQIGCTTPNADIYYEIVEVSGATAPSASSVEDPTHVSTYYDGTSIEMTVGNSYYVKAIAYVGNNPSVIAEGWYIIENADDFVMPTGSEATHYVKNCAEFNQLSDTYSGDKFIFANPVQVVYHSTYVNNGTSAEFCYVRDNTDYAVIYFGKADNNGYHIFQMGDWIPGGTIEGILNIYEHNYHNQLGTSGHTINATLWPSEALGWSEIIPETTTCTEISGGVPAAGQNKWGHYVHVRYSTLSGVHDETGYQQTGNYDMKHTGSIQDQTASELNYYDKFYLWSAGTCRYNNTTYTINAKGDYDQDFFDTKQNAGATFDVYGVVDWYGTNGVGTFQVCPIDFLWVYKPVISLASGTYNSEQTVNITASNPEWAAEGTVIYYKTDDMEDWAVYNGPITVNSDTHLQAYAEVPSHKNDGANYNDYVRSVIVEATYNFEGVEDPIITPASQVIEVVDGTESVTVTVETNPDSATGTVTLYTTDGSDPRTSSTAIELTSDNGTFTVTETTTVNAVSYLTSGDNTIWSNVVTETYEFIEDNGKTYNLLTTKPEVGSIYVIVNKADKVGLSKTQNATNRAATGVVFTDDATKTVVKGNTALEEFVLEAATAGRYYFRALNTSDYLVVTTNDNPNLMTGSADANAEAAVTVNSGVTSGVDESYPATITFNYDGTPRYLRYYAGGRTFTTYTAATTNQDIFLYGIEVPELLDPTIEPNSQVVQMSTGDESLTVTVTPNDQNPEGAVTYYTTDGSDPRTSSTRIEWSSENGEFSVNTTTTVKAVTGMEFGDGMVWSNVVSETYTFVGIEPPLIEPASQIALTGTSINVTVTTNPLNEDENVVTLYTTDGTDPRENGTPLPADGTITFPVTTTTTVTAVSCLTVTVGGVETTIYSPVVSETYNFVSVLAPTITPEGGNNSYGTTVSVTVASNAQSTSGTVTLYTTDGSDPRTNGQVAENGSVTFPVSENTTVRAISCYTDGTTTIWSDEVSETYTFETATSTPLHIIESEGEVTKPYTVADELIGTWAVVKPDGTKLLWAKDQGNISIDKRPAKTDKQMDYVKDILEYEWQETWDESNWVILNFANIDADPEEYVGHRITEASVEGIYANDVNFQIDLTKKPALVNDNPLVKDMPLYTGWVEPFPESKLGKDYDLAYNSFVPANFMTENHNHEVNGEIVGFIAGDGALGNLKGDSLYFVNPKIQEVAHIWAVWNEDNIFTVYQAEHKENENINAWNLNGTFRVDWTYNCKSKDTGINGYGEPTSLVKGVAYEFHVAVMRPVTSGMTLNAVAPQGTPNPGTPSDDYVLYPLDVSDGGTPTAVIEVNVSKTVIGVSYFNLMGQESNKPFEGINIVVTRYSDGSSSTVKVLK